MSLPVHRDSPWGSDWREQITQKLCLSRLLDLKWAPEWCGCPLRCQWRFPLGKTQGPESQRRTSRRAHPPWHLSLMWPAPCTTTWSRSSRVPPRFWKHPWVDRRDLCITLLWSPSMTQVMKLTYEVKFIYWFPLCAWQFLVFCLISAHFFLINWSFLSTVETQAHLKVRNVIVCSQSALWMPNVPHTSRGGTLGDFVSAHRCSAWRSLSLAFRQG